MTRMIGRRLNVIGQQVIRSTFRKRPRRGLSCFAYHQVNGPLCPSGLVSLSTSQQPPVALDRCGGLVYL